MGRGGGEFRISVSIGISFPAGLGLENPNSGPDPGGTFFPNSVSDLGSAGTFPKSRNVGPVIDENVCLLDSQPCLHRTVPTSLESCLERLNSDLGIVTDIFVLLACSEHETLFM